jgi:hypothetical protein
MKPNQVYRYGKIWTIVPEEEGLKIEREGEPDVYFPWPAIFLYAFDVMSDLSSVSMGFATHAFRENEK